MAKLSNFKRLIKEDFKQDQQELIDKLAFVINPFLEQVYNAFNKGINNDNLSRETITVTVENATGGTLKATTQFKTTLNSKVIGFNIINAENLTNPGTYPTNAPWVSFSVNGKIFTVLNVTGIQDNNRYKLTLELIS